MTTEQQREKCRRYYWKNVDRQRQRTLSNYHKWKQDPKKKEEIRLVNRKAKTRQRFGVNDRQEVLLRFKNQCANCGTTKNLHIHHIDNRGRKVGVTKPNNAPGNLTVLCIACHLQHHRYGKKVQVKI